MLLKLSHVRDARDVKARCGVSQGAPESPMLVDKILGVGWSCSLISEWTAQGVGWSFDQLSMTCLAHAGGVLLFADSLEKLTRMLNECCASFERAGLVVGADQTHWSSSVVLDGVTMRAGGHDVL